MNVYEANNYKPVLKRLLNDRRKAAKGVSRKLAEYLGVHPSLVSQVLTGSKDFSEEQLLVVCEFLGLGKLESKYLLALLQRERAGSVKLKVHFEEVIAQIRKDALKIANRAHRDKNLSGEEESIFYSSWIYSAVHLMTTLKEPVTFDKIVKRLAVSPGRAQEALDFLISSQLVKQKGKVYEAGVRATHLGRSSPHLPKHHSAWRLKAIQRAEELSDDELMYTANFSISRKDFPVLREEMMQTIQRFLSIVKESPGEEVAQFNIDLFWISS
jgi:uncharacterized protein (TIGR02147 family)